MSTDIKANFADFERRWAAQIASAQKALIKEPVFEKAYSRLISLQAWRSELLETRLHEETARFALEGQNDLLVSYILARSGQWRSALQSQRASLENYLNCLFFMDHDVELRLWKQNKHQTRFSELLKYFENHPNNIHRENKFCGLDIIKSEYATLSKAVHGSAEAFRMTTGGGPKFFSTDNVALQQWDHRHRQVVRGINLLLLSLFSEELVASRKRNLRQSVSLALRKKDKDWIKSEYSVTIPFE